MFLGSISSKITLTKEKERRKRKNKEEDRWRREKSNGRTLSFYNGYFGDVLLLDGKGPFSGNVFKNPARFINIYIFSSLENFQSLDCEHARAASLLLENLSERAGYKCATSEAASSELGGSLNLALQAKALEPFEINLSQIKQPHEKSFTAQTGTQINPRDLPR